MHIYLLFILFTLIYFIYLFLIVHRLFPSPRTLSRCSTRTQSPQRPSRGSWCGSYRSTSSSPRWRAWQRWTQAPSPQPCSRASSPRRPRTSSSSPRSQSTRSTGCTPSSRRSTPLGTRASRSAWRSWTPSRGVLCPCRPSAPTQAPPQEKHPSLSLWYQRRPFLSHPLDQSPKKRYVGVIVMDKNNRVSFLIKKLM